MFYLSTFQKANGWCKAFQQTGVRVFPHSASQLCPGPSVFNPSVALFLPYIFTLNPKFTAFFCLPFNSPFFPVFVLSDLWLGSQNWKWPQFHTDVFPFYTHIGKRARRWFLWGKDFGVTEYSFRSLIIERAVIVSLVTKFWELIRDVGDAKKTLAL